MLQEIWAFVCFVHYYILKSQGQCVAHDKALSTYLWNE